MLNRLRTRSRVNLAHLNFPVIVGMICKNENQVWRVIAIVTETPHTYQYIRVKSMSNIQMYVFMYLHVTRKMTCMLMLLVWYCWIFLKNNCCEFSCSVGKNIMQVPIPRLKKINKANTRSSPIFSLSKLVKQNETHEPLGKYRHYSEEIWVLSKFYWNSFLDLLFATYSS